MLSVVKMVQLTEDMCVFTLTAVNVKGNHI